MGRRTMMGRRLLAVPLFIVGALAVAVGALGDTLYSFTAEGRIGGSLFPQLPTLVYAALFIGGVGLLLLGGWLWKQPRKTTSGLRSTDWTPRDPSGGTPPAG